MTIFLYALIRSLRRRTTMAALLIIPLIMIFIRPLWLGSESVGFTFYPLLILFASFSMVRLIMMDRVTGTVIRIFIAPVTTLKYLTQNLSAFCSLISLQVILVISAGTLLYQWEILLAVRLAICYIIFTFTSVALSLAWYSLFRKKEISDAIFSIVVSFMSLLGGIFIPITLIPEILRRVGMLLPTYWLSNAVNQLLNNGKAYDYWISIMILCLFSIAFLLFGSKRRLE